MNQNREIQLDEEFKYDSKLAVPNEIYGKEYKMIYIPSQSKVLFENMEEKLQKNFIDLKFFENVSFNFI